MAQPLCRLECQWTAAPDGNGRLDFTLVNLAPTPLENFRLTYTTLTRANDLSQTENCRLISRTANNHQVEPPKGLTLNRGESWRFAVTSLTRKAVHRTDGVSTAFITLGDGQSFDIDLGDILLGGTTPDMPPELIPEGRVELPVSLIPWPRKVELKSFDTPPVALFPAGEDADLTVAMGDVAALAKRLFANAIPPFALTQCAGGRALTATHDKTLSAEAYGLDFTAHEVTLAYGDGAGLFYGLITLAQLLQGAHEKPKLFQFPTSGSINDSPRYSWRGCHLDVSRQVYPLADVKRFIDILAWNKMNIFHWHLTDDEGWRLEIKGYPELTAAGARQGPGEKMIAQLGTGAKGRGGYYTQDEVRELIGNARRLNIDIVPEFDIPGHCTAVLAALPQLRDPEEENDSYRSVQGYYNNALNPAVEGTYEFLETVFKEVADLFPSPYVHIGGDEVAQGAWLKSPKAQALMKEVKLDDTPQLQAYLLGQAKSMLTAKGKKLAGWNEVSHGGGVVPEDSLLMAWENPEVGIALAEEGYDVVMCPGQAYYLDMVQDDAFLEPGLSWAGTVPPKHTYDYEAEGEFPDQLRHKMKGVEGCIWSENLTSKARFNHMVFPRLSAIAEAGWTPKENKDWLRFAAISRLMPTL